MLQSICNNCTADSCIFKGFTYATGQKVKIHYLSCSVYLFIEAYLSYHGARSGVHPGQVASLSQTETKKRTYSH